MKKFIFVITIISFLIGNLAYSKDVNLQSFIQETQKMSQGQQSFRLIWWIPTEYWKEAFKNEANMTQNQKEAFYDAVDGYTVLSVIDAKTTDLGSIVPFPKEEILSRISLSVEQNKKMLPLSDDELTSDAKNLFAMMKPLMANMLGQFGQGMEFICFKGTDSTGARLLNPKLEKSFAVNYAGLSYKWRLPLGSLLPAKYDSLTGEEFPGNYIYNPFTGNKLVEK